MFGSEYNNNNNNNNILQLDIILYNEAYYNNCASDLHSDFFCMTGAYFSEFLDN
jgi:hypothetical protein